MSGYMNLKDINGQPARISGDTVLWFKTTAEKDKGNTVIGWWSTESQKKSEVIVAYAIEAAHIVAKAMGCLAQPTTLLNDTYFTVRGAIRATDQKSVGEDAGILEPPARKSLTDFIDRSTGKRPVVGRLLNLAAE